MFRFTIRDMLWLTAVVGVALVWRVEYQAGQRRWEMLNGSETQVNRAVLAGRWDVLEITSKGKVVDFRGKPAAHFSFDDGWWHEYGPGNRYVAGECRIVRPGEIDIDTTGVPGFTAPTKWRYKLEGGKLWMIRSKMPADRPSDFDATSEPSLTLYELKKAELEPQPPAQQPQPAVAGREY